MAETVLKVPYIDQSRRYPTGCESVSAVMLLQYLGIEITVDDWIQKELTIEEFQEKDGVCYGPDPRKVFCGDPYDEEGMGCYAPVIERTLNQVFEKRDLADQYLAVDETGTDMETLICRYLDRGMPVVYWACINMREPIIGPSWQLSDEPEKTFTWISNEHCMLLVGYDEEGYYFNDPYDNNGLIRYEKKLTEDRHRAQHSMAVGIKKSRL